MQGQAMVQIIGIYSKYNFKFQTPIARKILIVTTCIHTNTHQYFAKTQGI